MMKTHFTPTVLARICAYFAMVSICVSVLSHRPLFHRLPNTPKTHFFLVETTEKSPKNRVSAGVAAERKQPIEVAAVKEAPIKITVEKEAPTKVMEMALFEKPEKAVAAPRRVRRAAPDPLSLKTARGKAAEKLLHPVIIRVANAHDVDPALIKSIIWAESSFNPNAVSHKGAMGLMQLMPSTAKAMGIEDSLNPESNIDGGVRYFKKLLVRFKGDPELALAAYNAGSRRVLQYDGVPPFEATRYYIEKVFKYYKNYKQVASEAMDQI